MLGFGGTAAARAQLGLERRQVALGPLGLDLRRLAARAQAGPMLAGFALAPGDLGEPAPHALGFGGGLVRAPGQAGRALAQQHDLLLGPAALLLAIAQPALRRR